MTPEDRIELPEAPQPPSKAQVDRRRLLRGGLATAPALLTLVNRPVMAGTCRTASALGSASLSRAGSGVYTCNGKKPSTWHAAPEGDWPTGTRTQKFKEVFSIPGTNAERTLLEMVALSANSGTDGLAKHLVAAYLNALKGFTPSEVLSVMTVKDIWASFVALTYYQPTAGIKWYPDSATPPNAIGGGLIAWLQTTMPN